MLFPIPSDYCVRRNGVYFPSVMFQRTTSIIREARRHVVGKGGVDKKTGSKMRGNALCQGASFGAVVPHTTMGSRRRLAHGPYKMASGGGRSVYIAVRLRRAGACAVVVRSNCVRIGNLSTCDICEI